VAMLWAWSNLNSGRRWPAYVGGAVAALGLVLSNPLNAAALVVACGVGGLHTGFRSSRHVLFVALIGSLVAGVIIYQLATADLLASWQGRSGTLSFAEHFATLMVWQIKGLSLFEFFPLLLLPLLAVPWIGTRLVHLRPMAAMALTIFAMMMTVLAVVAALSPQDLAATSVADMRYGLQILVMGPVVTSAAVAVAASWLGRTAGVLMVTLIVFSNLPYWPQPALQCTICERISELGETHPSGSDAVIAVADTLPSGTRTMFVPDYLAAPAMFYKPDLLYAGMLDPTKEIDPDLRKTLPGYIFQGNSPPDVLVIGIGSVPLANIIPFRGSRFQLASITKTFWVDKTRPELPWHQFRADPENDKAFGIAIFRRVDGGR
jgi:hypothetical protein